MLGQEARAMICFFTGRVTWGKSLPLSEPLVPPLPALPSTTRRIPRVALMVAPLLGLEGCGYGNTCALAPGIRVHTQFRHPQTPAPGAAWLGQGGPCTC